ncbi:hypothetical protein M758_4G271000 [Ceratodon purpureus]|uniref:Uncharacterized protein n=1 Tax=Ceratodon purpureus TaxID=3225 RepID=A0A8T0ID01_CERPU|nr:hypothetical protein KC19_4G267400 [Ceratodon purpureus]KAG0621123.1 hypothetical protein M758_4G271000 [Ceratodon purpureus]
MPTHSVLFTPVSSAFLYHLSLVQGTPLINFSQELPPSNTRSLRGLHLACTVSDVN